jgi:DNA-binding MarR family transcriptional regulator
MEGPPDEEVRLDLATVLGLLSDAVDRRVLQALEGTGLRRGHGYLVQRLLAGPSTSTEIAEELGVTQQAVSKVVAELVALGHVEPAPESVDRRRRPVRLTRRGRLAVETARAARLAFDREVRDALGAGGFESTTAALTTALDALGLSEPARRRAVQPPGSRLD